MNRKKLNIALFVLSLSFYLSAASFEALRDCSRYRYLMFSDLGQETLGFNYSKPEKQECINTITKIFSKKFDTPFKYINNKTIYSIRQCIVPMLLMRIDSIDVIESGQNYKVNTMIKIIIFETPQCQRSKKEIALKVKGKFKDSRSKALSNNLLTASITISNWLSNKDYL